MKNKWIKLAIISLGIIIASCISSNGLMGNYQYTKNVYHNTPVKVIPIVVDKNFGSGDRREINLAIEQWNYSLNGFIVLRVENWNFDMDPRMIKEIVGRGGFLFLKIDGSNPIAPVISGTRMTVAFCNAVGGPYMYMIRDRLENEDIRYIIMHEIGHLMGAGHVGSRLMYPNYKKSLYQCIDRESLEVIAEAQRIPIERLNYCIYKD